MAAFAKLALMKRGPRSRAKRAGARRVGATPSDEAGLAFNDAGFEIEATETPLADITSVTRARRR